MNHKRLLIFGGSGFVGMHLARLSQRQSWLVTLSSRGELPVPERMAWQRADIRQKGQVLRAIEAARAPVVVNAAAQANIDLAEQDPSSTWQINVDGARYVADACAELGIRAIFFSSDAVFNGKGQNYTDNINRFELPRWTARALGYDENFG